MRIHELVTRAGALQLKAQDAVMRTASFVASTDAVDAHGDVVEQSWQLEHYKANPIVLYGHDSRELPIGQAVRIEVSGGRLETTIKFASAEANPRAEAVWKLIQEGVLRAVSVGFMPTDGKYEVRDGDEVFVWKSPVLKEISVVPVPANHEALARMKAAFKAASEETPSSALPGLTPVNVERKASAMELKDALTKVETLTAAHAKLEVEKKLADERVNDLVNQSDLAKKSLADAWSKTERLSIEKAALEAQTKVLAERAEKAEKAVAELEATTIDQEVDALVGKKISAAEKPLFVDLRKTNKDLFTKMIEQRTPLRLDEEVTLAGKKNGAAETPGDMSGLLAEVKKNAGL